MCFHQDVYAYVVNITYFYTGHSVFSKSQKNYVFTIQFDWDIKHLNISLQIPLNSSEKKLITRWLLNELLPKRLVAYLTSVF